MFANFVGWFSKDTKKNSVRSWIKHGGKIEKNYRRAVTHLFASNEDDNELNDIFAWQPRVLILKESYVKDSIKKGRAIDLKKFKEVILNKSLQHDSSSDSSSDSSIDFSRASSSASSSSSDTPVEKERRPKHKKKQKKQKKHIDDSEDDTDDTSSDSDSEVITQKKQKKKDKKRSSRKRKQMSSCSDDNDDFLVKLRKRAKQLNISPKGTIEDITGRIIACVVKKTNRQMSKRIEVSSEEDESESEEESEPENESEEETKSKSKSHGNKEKTKRKNKSTTKQPHKNDYKDTKYDGKSTKLLRKLCRERKLISGPVYISNPVLIHLLMVHDGKEEEDYNMYKDDILNMFCEDRGLKTTGDREKLIKRLEKYDSNNQNEEEEKKSETTITTNSKQQKEKKKHNKKKKPTTEKKNEEEEQEEEEEEEMPKKVSRALKMLQPWGWDEKLRNKKPTIEHLGRRLRQGRK